MITCIQGGPKISSHLFFLFFFNKTSKCKILCYYSICTLYCIYYTLYCIYYTYNLWDNFINFKLNKFKRDLFIIHHFIFLLFIIQYIIFLLFIILVESDFWPTLYNYRTDLAEIRGQNERARRWQSCSLSIVWRIFRVFLDRMSTKTRKGWFFIPAFCQPLRGWKLESPSPMHIFNKRATASTAEN